MLGDIELLTVDSMQVYCGMDIGTAKPTSAEQQLVRHHCINLVEPSVEFTVVDFVGAYDLACVQLSGRGLLVGGTGLYLRAVIDGLSPAGSWPDIRAELEAETDTAVLARRLADLDPVAAAKIEPANRRRLVRALEVSLGSGAPFSSYGPGMEVYAESNVQQIGLRWSREHLTHRVGLRVHQMMSDGFLAEVEMLARAPISRTARQALGYRELLEYLAGILSLDEAVATTIMRTRQFAVRQERWFRRDPRIRWIEIHEDAAEAIPAVLEALDA